MPYYLYCLRLAALYYFFTSPTIAAGGVNEDFLIHAAAAEPQWRIDIDIVLCRGEASSYSEAFWQQVKAQAKS